VEEGGIFRLQTGTTVNTSCILFVVIAGKAVCRYIVFVDNTWRPSVLDIDPIVGALVRWFISYHFQEFYRHDGAENQLA